MASGVVNIRRDVDVSKKKHLCPILCYPESHGRFVLASALLTWPFLGQILSLPVWYIHFNGFNLFNTV
jgi:hypothetical protein